MKTLYVLGACALLSTTLFSCTADEFETEKKTEIKKEVYRVNTDQANDGPDDDPVPVTPPKK